MWQHIIWILVNILRPRICVEDEKINSEIRKIMEKHKLQKVIEKKKETELQMPVPWKPIHSEGLFKSQNSFTIVFFKNKGQLKLKSFFKCSWVGGLKIFNSFRKPRVHLPFCFITFFAKKTLKKRIFNIPGHSFRRPG